MKLFWSRKYRRHWIAFSADTGLVAFPAEANGWRKRQPAEAVSLDDLREIPVRLAAYTGIPAGARKSGRKKVA
jgi:hypothetical protein